MRFPTFALTALIVTATGWAADFETLFNGQDLIGWKGLEGFWSVQDGAIVGETTAEKKIEANTFLVWQKGDVADFEFTATVRFQGNNSGVQYRSQVIAPQPFSLKGYQMDLHPTPSLFGMLYGEKYDGRGKIATRGQRLEVSSDGTVKLLGKVGNNDKLTDWEWNKLRIVAVGSRLIHQVNGVTTIDVLDHHKDAMASGVLGLQLHRGASMRVEFKDLRLRRLDPKEGQQLLSTVATNDTASPPAKQQNVEAGNPKTKTKAKAKKADDKTTDSKGSGSRNRATDATGLNVVRGFQVETVYSVPKETQGSWVSLTIDKQGRLIASDQGQQGLFRVTFNADGKPSVEKMPVDLSSAQGLLWKSGCLYASVTGEGMYRVTDTDGDDLLDHAELLSAYAERVTLKDLTGENFNPVPDFPIEPPAGPGQEWTLTNALAAIEATSPKNVSFERGRSLFHAVNCGACHRFTGLGGGVGPDLTSVPNKFDSRYLLEAIINPSKNISDQYQSSVVLLTSGKVLNGLVVEQGDDTLLVYSTDPKAAPARVKRSDIEELRPSPTSQMPTALLNRMSASELRNLVAYIMSGGNPDHKIFRVRGAK